MLPKSERLTKEDFTGNRPKVFFRGELLDIATVVLPTQKFACVISKKTLKKAVQRNFVKRRVLHVVKLLPLPLEKYSIIFYPKKGSYTAPHEHIQEEIKRAFATLH